MIPSRASIVLLAGVLAGCAAAPTLTPEQLDAIQTRPLDAPPDAAFRAAAGVMLDRGMMITLSDAGAGLVGGSTWSHAPAADHHHSAASAGALGEVMAWVRPAPHGGSILRVQFAAGGVRAADADDVSRFAEDVGRRALAAAPPRSTP